MFDLISGTLPLDITDKMSTMTLDVLVPRCLVTLVIQYTRATFDRILIRYSYAGLLHRGVNGSKKVG